MLTRSKVQLDSQHGFGDTAMRFSVLLLVSVTSGQESLFQVLKEAEPGVRYQVVLRDDGVTLLEVGEDNIKKADELGPEQGEEGGSGDGEVSRWIQRTRDSTSRKETELRKTPGRPGLVEGSVRRGQGEGSDLDVRRLWLELNSRLGVRSGSGGGSGVLGTGDSFKDIVRKTEPGVWYQVTRDERGESRVTAQEG